MIDFGLISVIVPVYNAEKYLRKCIDSVLAQTYENYEILLIDDGSTDNSLIICNEYKEKNNKVKVFHKENGGASSARNVGLKEAKGKYIYFLDSDDWLREDALHKLIFTAHNEGADLVFCEANAIDDINNKEYSGNYSYKTKYETDRAIDIMEKMMKKKEFHVAIWMLLLDKRIIDDNNLLFREGIIYEDMIISYQFYCFAKRAAHVNEKLYFRRYRENSVMTSKRTEKNLNSAATVYREVAAFMKSLPENYSSNSHIIRCAFNFLQVYRSMSSDVKKNNKAMYADIKKDILKNDAYGDTALKLDCYSHLLWFLYKGINKVFNR